MRISVRENKQNNNNNTNNSVQSKLGRGPRRGAVAHVRRIVPIGYNGASQIRPQKYPFPWTDHQTPLHASSLDPSDLRCQTASGSDPPFFHNALDRPTHGQTHGPPRRPIDRPRESLTIIGPYASNESDWKIISAAERVLNLFPKIFQRHWTCWKISMNFINPLN